MMKSARSHASRTHPLHFSAPFASLRFVLALALVPLLLAACAGTEVRDAFTTPNLSAAQAQLPASTPGPVPGARVQFPDDEAPHNVLTEWWYYTGHVTTADGARYGIEYVFFQGSRADFPVGYAAHFAVIDEANKSFHTDQDAAIIGKVPFGGATGFDLRVKNWTMKGVGGTDRLNATMRDGSFGIDITAQDTFGPTLQGGGQFSYGPGGSSYYYSRTRMEPRGTITVGGVQKQITGGLLWFDHQWGNFLPTQGGWDWFSTQLDDGTSLMIYNLKDAKGTILQAFGEYVPGCDGACSPTKPTRALDVALDSFKITPIGTWTSPGTGVTYPSGWRIQIQQRGDVPAMDLTYTPVIPQAELDTRSTTSVIYWEGDTRITGTKNNAPITGNGYVELTGYDKLKLAAQP